MSTPNSAPVPSTGTLPTSQP
ncbi:MAG: hypothetical protein JWN84_2905, partial [Nocardioides sp.]|nr:hypothetical protein [Nocardioides sp.]